MCPKPNRQKKHSDRPYIIINCAMSIDGKIALPSKKPIKLSSLEDFKRVYELRNFCDGILVGVNTILMDDPKLTVKSKFVNKPKNPIRIILDTNGRTPENAMVFDGSAKTYIVMSEKSKDKQIYYRNAEILYCPIDDHGQIALEKLVMILKKDGIENLLVEGGETVIYNFMKHRLVDELYVYISSLIIGGKDSPTLAGGSGAAFEDDVLHLQLFSFKRLGDGILLKYLAN